MIEFVSRRQGPNLGKASKALAMSIKFKGKTTH